MFNLETCSGLVVCSVQRKRVLCVSVCMCVAMAMRDSVVVV